MNTADQIARMSEWLETHPETFPRAKSDASDMDEDTLLRSFGGLSRSARDMQRRPLPVRVDELGYDRSGTYHPSQDGA